MERVITAANAGKLRCRILAEGANGPMTPDADEVLDQRRDEVFVIPDILCNSGGVIVSYFEWVQDLQRLFWAESEVNDRLEQLLDNAFTQVQRDAPLARNVAEPHRRDGDRRREGARRQEAARPVPVADRRATRGTRTPGTLCPAKFAALAAAGAQPGQEKRRFLLRLVGR